MHKCAAVCTPAGRVEPPLVGVVKLQLFLGHVASAVLVLLLMLLLLPSVNVLLLGPRGRRAARRALRLPPAPLVTSLLTAAAVTSVLTCVTSDGARGRSCDGGRTNIHDLNTF